MKEIRELTPLVKKWLTHQGYYLKVPEDRREGVDIEAEKKGQLWAVEAKGEQENVGAYRNTWCSVSVQMAQRGR
jgi:hypothetical protein